MAWIAQEDIRWLGQEIKSGNPIPGFDLSAPCRRLIEKGKVDAEQWVANVNINLYGEDLSPGDPIPEEVDGRLLDKLIRLERVTEYSMIHGEDPDRFDEHHVGGGWIDVPWMEDKFRKSEIQKMFGDKAHTM